MKQSDRFCLQIFEANKNDYEVVDIRFPTSVDARYLRVIPVTWNNWVAMRLEVIGFNCSCPVECSNAICEQGKLYHRATIDSWMVVIPGTIE